MFRLIITKFWPALIPLLIYIIWRFFIFPKIANDKQNKTKVKAFSYWLISTLIMLILSIMLFLFSESSQKYHNYKPAEIIDGKLKPAELK